ncbi:MAG: translation initiation factor [Bacteroidetes bacterium]|jgi:translation initiation factor 1|nr:translation initiation factor [Bacteroidota bacterium]HMT35350.1 translation initiation factor [Chitinophagaceae bacterium]MBK7041104.1 translation initiation factor [Bacteroidota bacterium]MBK7587735.1 translation initiation factor [Bacteroidota bacterium]MBK8328812.1 translation initiation factor [Bacteroidota bacterium]
MSKKKWSTDSPFIYSTNEALMKPAVVEIQATLPPHLQKLKVSLDTKQRAGKVVTLVQGFVGSEEDLTILGKTLKTKCGTGGSIKDQLILIQGDYKNKVIQILQQLQYKVS